MTSADLNPTLAALEAAFLSGSEAAFRAFREVIVPTGGKAEIDDLVPHSFSDSASHGRITARQHAWRLADSYHSLQGAARIANHRDMAVSPLHAWDVRAHTGRVRRTEVDNFVLAAGAWSPLEEVVRGRGEAGVCDCRLSSAPAHCAPSTGCRPGTAADIRELLARAAFGDLQGELALAATTSWAPGLPQQSAAIRIHYWEPGPIGGWVESASNIAWPDTDWFRRQFLPEPIERVVERVRTYLADVSPIDHFLELASVWMRAGVPLAARDKVLNDLDGAQKSRSIPGRWSFVREKLTLER